MENPPLQLPQVSRNVCLCSIDRASERKSQVTSKSELIRELTHLHLVTQFPMLGRCLAETQKHSFQNMVLRSGINQQLQGCAEAGWC